MTSYRTRLAPPLLQRTADQHNRATQDTMQAGALISQDPDTPKTKKDNDSEAPTPLDRNKMSQSLVRLSTHDDCPSVPPPPFRHGKLFSTPWNFLNSPTTKRTTFNTLTTLYPRAWKLSHCITRTGCLRV